MKYKLLITVMLLYVFMMLCISHTPSSSSPSSEPGRPVPASGSIEWREVLEAEPDYYVVEMNVSAYCPCVKCCGIWATKGVNKQGVRITASTWPAVGFFVAAPLKYPFGTKMTIPGYAHGMKVSVEDRGGAITGNKLDVFFLDHNDALKFGRQTLMVKVWK